MLNECPRHVLMVLYSFPRNRTLLRSLSQSLLSSHVASKIPVAGCSEAFSSGGIWMRRALPKTRRCMHAALSVGSSQTSGAGWGHLPEVPSPAPRALPGKGLVVLPGTRDTGLPHVLVPSAPLGVALCTCRSTGLPCETRHGHGRADAWRLLFITENTAR